MPNLIEIHPVVWAPNPNKQTDRQASFIYKVNAAIVLIFLLFLLSTNSWYNTKYNFLKARWTG